MKEGRKKTPPSKIILLKVRMRFGCGIRYLNVLIPKVQLYGYFLLCNIVGLCKDLC